ncbi:hypothetical protein ACHHV8_24280 [Paenibacillus sp. TAB 01]|uniref:hypothetical protein n=1 Tax=Paenibacillus sp. TAB 01 TaxID=3368988 RepID=UPI0037514850
MAFTLLSRTVAAILFDRVVLISCWWRFLRLAACKTAALFPAAHRHLLVTAAVRFNPAEMW